MILVLIEQLLAIGGHSGSIIFYNLKTGVSTSAKTVSTHAFVLFSNDQVGGNFIYFLIWQLVSAGRDNHLHFWDTSSLQIEKKISGPSSSLFALCKSSTNVRGDISRYDYAVFFCFFLPNFSLYDFCIIVMFFCGVLKLLLPFLLGPLSCTRANMTLRIRFTQNS